MKQNVNKKSGYYMNYVLFSDSFTIFISTLKNFYNLI